MWCTTHPIQETYEEAVERIVMAITDESIAQERNKRQQNNQAREKALTNPETLLEFATFNRERASTSSRMNSLRCGTSYMPIAFGKTAVAANDQPPSSSSNGIQYSDREAAARQYLGACIP